MRRDITASIVAIVVMTLVLGVAYPLLTTGVAQVVFNNKANGSRVERDGKVVGSRLIGQDFRRDPRWFQSRPSQTKYSGDVTFFGNLGPNSKDLSEAIKANLDAYLALERPFDRGLTASAVPVDAITESGSGVDPQISQANARIQANRVAKTRGIPLGRVNGLIDDNTDGRALGFLGEPGVNVLELNLAVAKETTR